MKGIKYVIFGLFIFLNSLVVYASQPVVNNISIKERNGNVTGEIPSVDQDIVSPKIRFNNVGSSIVYQFNVNYDSFLYKIDSISDNNSNSNIKTSYEIKGDKVLMKLTYKSEAARNFNMNDFNISVKLVAKNVNPKTGTHPFIYLFIALNIVMFLVGIKKYKKILVCLLLLFPLVVSAKEKNTISIRINASDIKIGGRYTIHFEANEYIVDGSMNDIECMHNERCQLPKNNFSRYESFFNGWSLDKNGLGSIADESKVYNLDDETNSDYITLYAIMVPYVEKFQGKAKKYEYTVPASGRYKLEVWGAGGGWNYSVKSGRGGYASGIINLTAGTKLYIYVGDEGGYVERRIGSASGGFNGGGAGYTSVNSNNVSRAYTSAGGGATDIRVGQDSLYARVIVAGGGGGASYYSSTYNSNGGHGGYTGGNAYLSSGKQSGSLGGGGSQTGPGSHYGSGSASGFGVGGSNTSNTGGGGGGGWYGGGAGNSNGAGGGGGSSYAYTASTASYYPSGCLLNSSYYMTDTVFYSGSSSSMPDIDGGTGTNYGMGKAKITYLGN